MTGNASTSSPRCGIPAQRAAKRCLQRAGREESAPRRCCAGGYIETPFRARGAREWDEIAASPGKRRRHARTGPQRDAVRMLDPVPHRSKPTRVLHAMPRAVSTPAPNGAALFGGLEGFRRANDARGWRKCLGAARATSRFRRLTASTSGRAAAALLGGSRRRAEHGRAAATKWCGPLLRNLANHEWTRARRADRSNAEAGSGRRQ